MARIRILPDNVANQIAAGEVVERPVSVIKELIENSLDAGATRIEVEFRNGGMRLMRVEDNGCGMLPDESLLCLERHATSKLSSILDLNTMGSFGFRGEAIPSIASVSRFVLRTRAKATEIGVEVLINGGKLIYRKDYGMPVGTTIEVSNLFNTVPARRKFLKSENTEAAHITHTVRLYAVSQPHVMFTLTENGRVIFKSPTTVSLSERVGSVWSTRLAQELVEMDIKEGELRLKGLISKPGVGRATRQEIITLVNGRPVVSKTLNFAIIEAYHTYVPKGRYPVVFCFLELPPEQVDVNVHPAKKEIRFRKEAWIRQFVIQAVQKRLGELSEVARQGFVPSQGLRLESPVPQFTPAVYVEKAFSTEGQTVPLAVPATAGFTPMIRPSLTVVEVAKPEPKSVTHVKPSTWRFVGYLREVYGLFEAEEGLVVMDFKRAQTRVLYERIQQSFKGCGVASQVLLFPIPIELEPLAAQALEAQLVALNHSGFKIEIFGRNFYRIEAVPAWLDPEKAKSFVSDVAALAQEEGGSSQKKDIVFEKAARMASVNHRLSGVPKAEEEVMALLKQLLACGNPLTCPEGYATYYETSYRELGNKFGH